MHLRIVVPLLALASINTSAQDWTATVGLQSRDTTFSLPANPYENTSISTTATLLTKVNPVTFVGGNLAYGLGNTDASTNRSNIDTNSVAGAVFVLRDIGSGLLLDTNLGYGKVALDNAYMNGATRVTYSADTNFIMAGLGLTMSKTLSSTLNGSLSTRYTYVNSDNKSYIDSTGASKASTSNTLGFITLGGGLNWRLGAWEPNARLNWNVSNKEFASGTGDKNYFNYTVGVGYRVSPKTKVNLGYTGIAGKAYTKEDAFMLSLNTSF